MRKGQRHGKLVLIELVSKPGGFSAKCRCDCGNVRTFQAANVFGKRPRYAACNINGCRQIVCKHGHKAGGKVSREYRAWYAMIDRCCNPRCKDYKRYGKRGITVCHSW